MRSSSISYKSTNWELRIITIRHLIVILWWCKALYGGRGETLMRDVLRGFGGAWTGYTLLHITAKRAWCTTRLIVHGDGEENVEDTCYCGPNTHSAHHGNKDRNTWYQFSHRERGGWKEKNWRHRVDMLLWLVIQIHYYTDRVLVVYWCHSKILIDSRGSRGSGVGGGLKH